MILLIAILMIKKFNQQISKNQNLSKISQVFKSL